MSKVEIVSISVDGTWEIEPGEVEDQFVAAQKSNDAVIIDRTSAYPKLRPKNYQSFTDAIAAGPPDPPSRAVKLRILRAKGDPFTVQYDQTGMAEIVDGKVDHFSKVNFMRAFDFAQDQSAADEKKGQSMVLMTVIAGLLAAVFAVMVLFSGAVF